MRRTVIPFQAPPSVEEVEIGALRERLTVAVRRVCPPALAADADDLVQMAILRVMDLRRRDPERTFSSSYLQRTAYSALIDEIRRRRRRSEEPLEDEEAGPLPVVDHAADPERRASGREMGDAIAECLGRMVSARRKAVVLHLQGHNVPEAAKLLEWGRKRVENLVYRGLTDLRQCLELKGVTP